MSGCGVERLVFVRVTKGQDVYSQVSFVTYPESSRSPEPGFVSRDCATGALRAGREASRGAQCPPGAGAFASCVCILLSVFSFQAFLDVFFIRHCFHKYICKGSHTLAVFSNQTHLVVTQSVLVFDLTHYCDF